MKKIILLFLIVGLAISMCSAEVAERTKEICDDLHLGSGTYFFAFNDTFDDASQVQAVLLKNLNFTKFDKVNHPLDYYNLTCYGIPLTCSYPQLGITVTSGQGVTIDCSHEGPTHEEAKNIWLATHKAERVKEEIEKWIGVISLFLLGAGIIYLGMTLKNKDKKMYEDKIRKWIKYYLKKGYPKNYLKNFLITKGHSKEVIERLFKKL